MPTVSTTQKTEVTISTSTKARLMQRLRAWQQLQEEIAALEHAKAKLVNEIEEIRAVEVGEASFGLDGFRISRVEGTRSTFDKKAFVMLGGDLKLYDAAHVTKPNKPYTRISTSGDSDE